MALCALSSDIAASALISSRSCARVFISKSCSINHGPLRLVLGHCCFCTHFIQIMRQGDHQQVLQHQPWPSAPCPRTLLLLHSFHPDHAPGCSSASLAASTMALCALSSDIAASALISSRSCARVFISCSHFCFAPTKAWLVQVASPRDSLVSASSASAFLLFLSACSRSVLASSRAFWLAWQRRSAAIRASWAAARALASSSRWTCTSRTLL